MPNHLHPTSKPGGFEPGRPARVPPMEPLTSAIGLPSQPPPSRVQGSTDPYPKFAYNNPALDALVKQARVDPVPRSAYEKTPSKLSNVIFSRADFPAIERGGSRGTQHHSDRHDHGPAHYMRDSHGGYTSPPETPANAAASAVPYSFASTRRPAWTQRGRKITRNALIESPFTPIWATEEEIASLPPSEMVTIFCPSFERRTTTDWDRFDQEQAFQELHEHYCVLLRAHNKLLDWQFQVLESDELTWDLQHDGLSQAHLTRDYLSDPYTDVDGQAMVRVARADRIYAERKSPPVPSLWAKGP